MTKEPCGVSLEPNRPVRVTTIFSECDQMAVNHSYHLHGPILQPTRQGAVCVTALSAVHPMDYGCAIRHRITANELVGRIQGVVSGK